MSDDVIDLTKYLGRPPPGDDRAREGARANFSVWGGEGERSRFALPVWRAIYLVGGRRGGLMWVPERGGGGATPIFVLDLAAEPARTAFDLPEVGVDIAGDAPDVFEAGDTVAVYLGVRSERRWFLVLDDRDPDSDGVAAATREDLMFLAGECAGLLFFRELAEAGEELDLD